jgi:(R,R)-butanediol dehydrogenase / meso-butanediol dehydrogenase / diacetyl reductase
MNRAAFYRTNHLFEVAEMPPVSPGPGQIAIEVAYCGICGTDMHVFHGDMDARVGSNRVIGHEISGRVRALGEGVSGPQPGDPVVVRPLAHCGDCPACHAGHSHICHNLKFLGLDSDGGMQTVWVVPAHTVHSLPHDINLKHAALVEPLAVACHDVRRARLLKGESAVVIGGGPIGVLIGLVAQRAGAEVLVCEVNAARRTKIAEMGLAVADPATIDVAKQIQDQRGGADVVFEVSGSNAGAAMMTTLAATRGRMVMVGINNRKPPIDVFQFFWRELDLIGARVYETKDYEDAIQLVAEQAFDFDAFISDIRDLSEIQDAFVALDRNPDRMKVLLKVGETA